MPTDLEFAAAAGHVLQTVLEDIEAAGAGIACDLAGDLLTMRLPDGTQCCLIRQTPGQQIWLSEGVLASYFDWHQDTGAWIDARRQIELGAVLRAILLRRTGKAVAVRIGAGSRA
jgi:iron donor protein CyaY